MITAILKELKSALKYCPEGSNLCSSFAALVNPLYYAHAYARIDESNWKELLIPLQQFAKEVNQFLSTQRPLYAQVSEKLESFHNDALRYHSTLDEKGFFNAFNPSLRKAILMAKLLKVLDIKSHSGKLVSSTLGDEEINCLMENMHIVLHSTDSLYSCLETMLSSPLHLQCPISAINKAASLYNLSRPAPLAATDVSVSTGQNRFLLIFKAMTGFFQKLETLSLHHSQIIKFKNFVSALLDSPFLPPANLASALNEIKIKVRLDPTLRQPVIHNGHFIIADADRRLWPTRVTYKAYRLEEANAVSYPRFCDAVLRLHTLSHPSIITLHGAQWPLSPLFDNRPRPSEPSYAIIVTEQMTTSLVSAMSTSALTSRDTRIQILLDVLSGIAALHNSGVRHGAINTRTIFLNIEDGVLYGHAKLDLPPLVDFIFSPSPLSTMALEELMFQAPDDQHRNGTEYLTGDLWSFGLIACFLLSEAKSILRLKENFATIFLREGKLAMAQKCLKEISNPDISALISRCLRENPTDRITISELVGSLSPLLKQKPGLSQFVKREADIANINDEDITHNISGPADKSPCPSVQKTVKQEVCSDPERPIEGRDCGLASAIPGNYEPPMCSNGDASKVQSNEKLNEKIPSENLANGPLINTAACDSSREDVPGTLVTAVNSDVTKPLVKSDGENSFEHALMDIAAYGAKQAAKEVENARRKMRDRQKSRKSPNYQEGEPDLSSPQHGAEREENLHQPFYEPCMNGSPASLQPRDADVESSKVTKTAMRDTENYPETEFKTKPNDTKILLPKLHCPDKPKDDSCGHQNSTRDKMEVGTEKEGTWKCRVRAQTRSPKNYADPGSSDDFSDDSDDGDDSSQMPEISQNSIGTNDSVAVNVPQLQSISNSTIKSSSAFSEDKPDEASVSALVKPHKTIKQEDTKHRKVHKRRRSSSDSPVDTFGENGKTKVHKKESFELNKPFPSDFFIIEPSTGPGHQNLMLGIRLEEGRGVPPNFLTAVMHYQSAAAQGNIKAKVRLARCNEKGIGIPIDPQKASSLYCSAADEGECDAFLDAGRCCELGIGMSIDYARALQYYEQAASNGNADAMVSAGKLIRSGLGTEKDEARAFGYFTKARNLKNVQAKIELASCYAKGHGVKRCILKAVELYREAAADGDPSAMLALGLLYEDGNGLRKSCDKALRLYRKSAKLGHGPGETALGQCYLWGYGVPLDYVQAKEFFLSAARKGHALAFHELGMLYKEGNGVRKDMQVAANHFRTAAVMGCEVGMVQLGECLYNGSGTQQDFPTAFEWFRKASEAGAADGSRWLGDCYADGSGTVKDAKKAIECYKKASDLGSAPALTSLASCHENGIGVPVNVSKAVSMYRRAADSGDRTAENNLGIIYENGKFVKRDYKKAVSHYRKAIQLGSVEAMCNLADCYAAGNGVEKCLKTAIKWYKEGAKQGLASAKCELGICYYEGKGVTADPRRAVELFREASDSEAEALRQLGRAYSEGNGVERDSKRAFECLLSAATNGENLDACFDVGKCYDFGVGVAANPEEAKGFYTMAAKSGNKLACNALGNLFYKEGRFNEATKWFKLCYNEVTSTDDRDNNSAEGIRKIRKN